MIVAGFGFRQEASAESLYDVFNRARGDSTPECLATATEKAEAQALTDLAARLGLPIEAISKDALMAQTTLTESGAARTAFGTGSVAEAAALAAAGPGARLVGPRIISSDRHATCALAVGAGQ